MLIPSTINRQRHYVLESNPPFLSFLRREFPAHASTFFLLRFEQGGTFSVCGWVNKDRGFFVELLALGEELRFGKQDAADFRTVMNPPKEANRNAEKLGQILQSKNRGEDNEYDEDVREYLEAKKHLQRKTSIHRRDHPWFDDTGVI